MNATARVIADSMNRITTIEVRPTRVLKPQADTYVAKKPGRKTRRVLAAMLKRGSIAQAQVERTEYRRIEVDHKRVLDLIMAQVHNAHTLLGRGGETVLIGYDQWAGLVGEAPMSLVSLHIEYGHPNRVLGMTVKVIPWMSGVLVLPKGVL